MTTEQLPLAETDARATGPGLPQYFDFTQLAPDEISVLGSRTWLVRAHNIVFALTDLVAGDTVTREGEPDEHMIVVLGTDQHLEIRSGVTHTAIGGRSIVIAPSGGTSITAVNAGRVIRLFALSATDLARRCRNANYYLEGNARSVSTQPWPEPAQAGGLHVYRDLDEIPSAPDRLGRIYRNRHAMVNFLYPRIGPRDPSTLSPHLHEDFEQLSYAESGEYVHHLRHSWGKDRREWRVDEHVRLGSPSLVIIPPPVIHTSEAVGAGENQLLDVFAGPRVDFSDKPGWVLNAADYPAPSADS